jgi:hypothetical protein
MEKVGKRGVYTLISKRLVVAIVESGILMENRV